MTHHEQFMTHALRLAKKGEGLTRPNPPVGAILVKHGEIFGEGWHEQAGMAHAEVACFNSIPDDMELDDAVLYITLEPCCTEGKTPACTDLILRKGIKKVVIAIEDPNPNHSGKGIKILKEAGIEVISGICEDEAKNLIAPFYKRIKTGMPYITLKLAITLDGKIADFNSYSKWISGASSREEVQKLRQKVDAIMVGAGTIRSDNPSLLPRPKNNRNPWRIIVGENIPNTSKVLTDEFKSQTLLYSGDLEEIIRDLADHKKVMHILCEGGGILATSLLRAKLVDEVYLFLAPKLLGRDGISFYNEEGRNIDSVCKLRYLEIKPINEDLLIRAKIED